jgi:hypothetical protein
MTIAAVDETDYNLWLDALSDTLEIREMAIQVGATALRVCLAVAILPPSLCLPFTDDFLSLSVH